MSDFGDLEAWASGLIAQLAPGSRRQLALRLAKDLRSANQKRIAAQTSPEGEAYAPRKSRLRQRTTVGGAKQLRQGVMFKKLRLAKYLKTSGSAAGAVVEFEGAVQRIAQVHHHGLRDRVNKQGSGPQVQYTARPLLGISEADCEQLKDLILAHMSR